MNLSPETKKMIAEYSLDVEDIINYVKSKAKEFPEMPCRDFEHTKIIEALITKALEGMSKDMIQEWDKDNVDNPDAQFFLKFLLFTTKFNHQMADWIYYRMLTALDPCREYRKEKKSKEHLKLVHSN